MVVLFTGISGCKASESLYKFRDNYPAFRNLHSDNKPEILKIEDEIKILHRERVDTTLTDEQILRNWLNHPYSILRDDWNLAFKLLCKKIKDTKDKFPEKPVFVCLHTCYFHNLTQEYISLINEIEIKENLKKYHVVVVNLIDDIYEVFHRLSEPGGLFCNEYHTPSSIISKYFLLLNWRAQELMMSKFLASQVSKKCQHFIFALKHSKDVLYKLIYEYQSTPTVYLSHPISEVRRLESDGKLDEAKELVDEITALSKSLSDSFTTFLPTTIDELRINKIKKEKTKYTEPSLKPRWEERIYQNSKELCYIPSGFDDQNELWKSGKEYTANDFTDSLSILISTIRQQITIRDFSLVEQSQILVIYRPLYNGNASGSVIKEFDYFKKLSQIDKNKLRGIYIYCPQSDINDYYYRQFNIFIITEIGQSYERLDCPKDKPFTEISTEECENLLRVINSKGSYKMYLESVLKNHGLTVRIGHGPTMVADHEAVSKYKDKLVNALENIYSIVPKYLNPEFSTYFWLEKMTPMEFCSKIIEKIKNKIN